MSTPKTFQLNISERLNALSVLNGFKGNLDKLSIILEDIKQFPITEEEWTKAERVIEPAGDGNTTWKWQDDKGGDKDISIQSETIEYLKTTIKERDSKGEFEIKDRPFITLLAKLNA